MENLGEKNFHTDKKKILQETSTDNEIKRYSFPCTSHEGTWGEEQYSSTHS
jgi:hypothetical protein